jgi:hypothetical protein
MSGDPTVRANVQLQEGPRYPLWESRFFALPRVGDTIEAYDHCDDRLVVVGVGWAPIPDGSYKPTIYVEREVSGG